MSLPTLDPTSSQYLCLLQMLINSNITVYVVKALICFVNQQGTQLRVTFDKIEIKFRKYQTN